MDLMKKVRKALDIKGPKFMNIISASRSSAERRSYQNRLSGVFSLSPQDHVGMSKDDIVMARITSGDWEYFPPEKW